jgi:hypothetical protein
MKKIEISVREHLLCDDLPFGQLDLKAKAKIADDLNTKYPGHVYYDGQYEHLDADDLLERCFDDDNPLRKWIIDNVSWARHTFILALLSSRNGKENKNLVLFQSDIFGPDNCPLMGNKENKAKFMKWLQIVEEKFQYDITFILDKAPDYNGMYFDVWHDRQSQCEE